jgi:hypothetical protein
MSKPLQYIDLMYLIYIKFIQLNSSKVKKLFFKLLGYTLQTHRHALLDILVVFLPSQKSIFIQVNFKPTATF